MGNVENFQKIPETLLNICGRDGILVIVVVYAIYLQIEIYHTIKMYLSLVLMLLLALLLSDFLLHQEGWKSD